MIFKCCTANRHRLGPWLHYASGNDIYGNPQFITEHAQCLDCKEVLYRRNEFRDGQIIIGKPFSSWAVS